MTIHKAFPHQIVDINNITESNIAKQYTEDGQIQLPSNVSVQLVDDEKTIRTYDLMDLISLNQTLKSVNEKLRTFRIELNNKLDNDCSATDEDEYLRDEISRKISETTKKRNVILSVLRLYRYWQIKQEIDDDCQFSSFIGIYGFTENKEN
jgi:hypothetical protein